MQFARSSFATGLSVSVAVGMILYSVSYCKVVKRLVAKKKNGKALYKLL